MKRLLLVAAAVAAGGAAFALSALTSSGTTIGQTATTPGACVGDYYAVQTGVDSGISFTVPSGTWQTTSWTTNAGPDSGPMAAMIFRPTGTADEYSVVAISDTVSATPNSVNTFPWSATIRGGDILGLWVETAPSDCAENTGRPGDTFAVGEGGLPEPAPGDTVAALFPVPSARLNISASLVGQGSDESAVDHVYVCYSKFEQDGGEVEDPATGTALVAAGRWYPTALPGNVDGGENVGAYHLDCNPPATSATSGLYIGLGGTITDDPGGSYAVAH